jgi:LuxR family transcriptional regulator, maltose regulon positive regulatory protein
MTTAMTRERPALPVNGNVMATSEGQGMAPRDVAGLVGASAGGRPTDHPRPPLLVSKLTLPSPLPTLVARPRLTARLQAAENCRLALVVAPAGSGKSSVVSQWCQEQAPGRVAWLSLDANDNDPRRFLHYLCAALERIVPEVAGPVRALLQTPQPPASDEALTHLLNGLAALEHPVTLVLDDYHEIESFVIHQIVAFLLEHLPPTLFLILVTRSDPLLPLARLRARGQLVELRTRDLRFTPAEAGLFLNESMGLAVDNQAVERLAEQTEGWIAGLQLAALSLQGETDPSRFLEGFTGSNRYLVDYLCDEVLRRQPEEVRAFLGQTAFLERLCGPLCEAVTETPGGQEMLERLEAANLFLIPLDRERRWYRYHQLFADVLRARLMPEQGEQLTVLRERAAAWYEAEGMTDQAIEQVLACEQFDRAASLIERQYESVWQPGLGRSLERWLQALPPTLIRTRPYLSFVLASLHCHHFRAAAAEEVLNECRFEPQDDTSATRELHGRLLMARSWTARLRGDKTQSARLSSEVLDVLPADSRIYRSYARFNLAMLHQERGELAVAGEAFADTVREAQQAVDSVLRVRASYGYGQLRESQGALEEASRVYLDALEYAEARHILHTPAAALLYAGLGRISYLRNDLAAAGAYLAEGLERVDSAWAETNPIYAVPGLFELLQLQTTWGATAAAEAMFERLTDIARAIEVPCLEPVLALSRVRKKDAPAELTAAWLTAFEARTTDEALPSVPIPEVRVPDIQSREIVTWARLRLSQGQTSLVLPRLERFLETMVRQGRHGGALPVRVLLATLYWQAHRRERAAAVLEPALALAAREGYTRVFLEAGGSLIPVLRYCVAQAIVPEVGRQLLTALCEREPSAGEAYEEEAPTLVEPLSGRQLEVLRLAAAGLSNEAIAEQLFLSAGTVKCHLHQIYGKLAATGRFSAVMRARELQLL